MKPPLSYAPAFPAAIGLAAGVACSAWGWFYVAFFGGVVLFAALYYYGKHYASFLALMFALGAALAFARAPHRLPEGMYGSNRVVVGKVLALEDRPETQRCVLRIDSCDGQKANGAKCVAYIREPAAGLEPGAMVKIKGTLFQISSDGLLPHEVDYGRYLRAQGITCSVTPNHYGVQTIKCAKGWRKVCYSAQCRLFNGIVNSPVNGRTAAFLLASILGDDAYLSADLQDGFRATGVSHVLALSGLHVGILATLLSLVLWPVRFVRGGLLVRSALVLFLVWTYAFVVGMGASVLRAATMLSMVMFAQMVQRGSNAYNSLCVAIVMMLVVAPYSMFTPGFQLSVAAVASILLFSDLLPQWVIRRPVARFIASMFIVPVSAMVGTGIVSAYYFNMVPWAFLPANIMAGLIFPWLLGIGIVLMLLTMCGLPLAWLGTVADWLYSALDHSVGWCASWHLTSQGIFLSGWMLLPYSLAVVMMALSVRRCVKGSDPIFPKLSIAAHWGATALLLAISAVMAFALRERLPRAELYWPRGPQAALVLRTEKRALLVGLDQPVDTVAILDAYAKRFSGFLKSRKCEGFEFMDDSCSAGPFFYRDGMLVAGDTVIAILPQASVRHNAGLVVIGKTYDGDGSAVKMAYRPDSVLFTRAMNGNRAKKLRRELADTTDSMPGVPGRRIENDGFSIIIK